MNEEQIKIMNNMFDLVMKTCTQIEKGELDDLGGCCIIMDAVNEIIVKKENSPS